MQGNDRLPHDEVFRPLLRYRFFYSMTGLVLGLICIIGGIVLFLMGVTGSVNWTAKVMGNESTLSNAAPGALLFVVGLFVVFMTKSKVRIRTPDWEIEAAEEEEEE